MRERGAARVLLTAVAPLAALLALGGGATGCDGSKAGGGAAAQASTVKLTCGTYNSGMFGGLVVAAFIEPPRPHDLVLAGTSGWSVTCRAGTRACFVALPGFVTWKLDTVYSETLQLQFDAGRGPEVARCPLDGHSRIAQTEGTAEVVGGTLQVKWGAVAGTAKYVATLRDLDLGPPAARRPRILGSVATAGTLATFDLSPWGGRPPDLAVVEVEAWVTDPDAFAGSSLPPGGANRSVRVIPVIGAPWALRQPSEFDAAGTLTLPVPEGRRLAVIPLNLEGEDGARLTLDALGTSAARPPAPALPAAAPRVVEPLLAPGRAMAGAVTATARGSWTSRTFCTIPDQEYLLWLALPNGSDPPAVRRLATLALETDTALFYVDDDDAAGFTTSDWERLASWWDDHVFPALTTISGPPSDVDGNGRFILFFTSALGPRTWSYANVYDVWSPLNTSPDCAPPAAPLTTDSESNRADMIQLHPPFGMENDLGQPIPTEVQWAVVEGRMAYSFQRMLDSARWGTDYRRDNAITYARMSLAETLSGRGNHSEAFRTLAARALLTRAGLGPAPGWGGYPTVQLLPYELYRPHQEVIRAAVDSFILYLGDRLGQDYVAEVLGNRIVMWRDLEVTSGIPLPILYALWTGALLFSNEPASPWQGFDYLGADWTPFHEKFMPLEYAPLESGIPADLSLRPNGFDVYVTGVAVPGGGTVTVTLPDPQQVRPYVVAIPFQGELP
jgi:hypothetical protein